MSSRSPVVLSIIVPAFRVQGYLRECLNSILRQPCAGIEVVAVDDCSPDACGAIMDEFAEQDPRLRVLHLDSNVGLGEGRNLGLDAATGEYVWFVDSDDWVGEGALQAILDRLHETRPDVLVFDYARAYWNGKTERNTWNYLFREPPAPRVFTLHERPSVMELMMTAWNKVIRRRFLLDLNVRFGRGYYEDVPVTYPVLMAARCISLLDRVCYYYRQRRSGAITRTVGTKHFDAFGQYEKIFAFMDRQGASVEEFRPLMFERMLWHYLVILGRGDRVSRAARRQFFHHMSEHYRWFHPGPAYALPEGRRGLKRRLVGHDAYRTFCVLKALNLTRLALLGYGRRVRGRARRVERHVRAKALGLYYRLQLRLPMRSDLAVYASYWYRGYSCNPRAIYEKARELVPGVHGVWIVRRGSVGTVPEGVDYVIAGGRRYLRLLARAKYLVNNVNFPDNVVKRPGSVHVETQHGTPLKTMGLDQQYYPVGAAGMNFKKLLDRCDRWDFLISSNQLSTEVWEEAYPCRYEVLETGYPRNDRFFTASAAEVAALRRELGVGPEQTAVLYAPTHRDYQRRFEPMLDLNRLAAALGPGYVLLARAHYYYAQSVAARSSWDQAQIVDVSRHPLVEDLCLAADVLLTDYSSIMFDYANLDRPIVVYANDWETYKRTRGVYFELPSEPPGAVATTEDELIAHFTSGKVESEEATRARAEFRRRFCRLDDGHAAERVVRRVFLAETLQSRAHCGGTVAESGRDVQRHGAAQ